MASTIGAAAHRPGSDPLGGGGAKLIAVPHVRQEKVSSCGLRSLDLLPNMATPHSGQCCTGGRGWAGLGTGTTPQLPAQPARLEVGPAQCGGKSAESGGDDDDHDDVRRHRKAPSVHREHGVGGAVGRLDPDQNGGSVVSTIVVVVVRFLGL